MKKLIIACAGIAALVAGALQPAAAADVPMVYSRPPAYVIFTWTGFYFGAHGGGAWGRKEATAALPFTIGIVPVTPAIASTDPTGGLAGGQIGANYQSGSFVFGVEADASWSDLTGSSTCSLNAGGLATFAGGCNSKVQGLGTIAGRLGVAFDRTLVYGKGGAAWANDKYELNTTILNFNANETRWGWMLGGGVEYSFTDNWSAKIEYNYLDFGTRGIEFTDTTDQFSLNADIRQRIHVVKAGINYRFGWAPVGVIY
jgi:outer membrane immunogenic protein